MRVDEVARVRRGDRGRHGDADRAADLLARVDQPEATPASAGWTPVSAPIDIGTNANASPMPLIRNAGKRSPEVVPVDRQPRVEDRAPTAASASPSGSTRRTPSRVDERLRDAREDDDRERQGDVGDARLDRRVVQHLLHVQRQQEELREHRAADQEAA